jgi:hypothetical protein
MNGRNRRLEIAGLFALLLIVDWFLYFRHAPHFFQGDTVFLLSHRAASVSDYLKEFIQLNPSGWYRPLANELFESILYPAAGLRPVPYRIPVYAVFVAITAGVYALAFAVTRRGLAAALAVFFFTIHTTNAYTTYDIGFMPELLYTLFYIGAMLTFLRYVQDKNRTAYRLSLACFAGSLLSKEAAVTLPGALFLMSFTFATASDSLRERFMGAVRSIAPHALLLAVYLAFAIGYLNVQTFSVSRLLDPSQVPNEGDYIPVLSGGIFKNADLALTWAFNIPRGSWGQWHDLKPQLLAYLKFFRALMLVLTAAAFVGGQDRRVMLFGLALFWITLIPALPLVSHFLPYYLFLPVAGLSIVVGCVFARFYDALRRFQPIVAAAAIVLIFGGVLTATSRSIRGNIRDNPLLGGSSRLASNTLNDLKRLHPALPPGATLYFADAGGSLAWAHNSGGLIKMAYGTDKISVLYQSQGDSLVPETRNVLLFGVQNGRLIDETARYRSNPADFLK